MRQDLTLDDETAGNKKGEKPYEIAPVINLHLPYLQFYYKLL
jgi:hypothetical protein